MPLPLAAPDLVTSSKVSSLFLYLTIGIVDIVSGGGELEGAGARVYTYVKLLMRNVFVSKTDLIPFLVLSPLSSHARIHRCKRVIIFINIYFSRV